MPSIGHAQRAPTKNPSTMDHLHFGTAGIPLSVKSQDSLSGIERLHQLGLDCMELEFVQGVHLKKPAAEKIALRAKELGVALSAHAPYYINLNSHEIAKKKASVRRILETARAAFWAGAATFTFHAAFYQESPPDKVYQTVKEELEALGKTLEHEKLKIWMRPELTGKPTQFGSLEEILRLSREVPMVAPCIDFAHFHARDGRHNTYKEFRETLETVEAYLGPAALEDMHIHVSGIDYGPKGERKHLALKESDFNYPELLGALKDKKAKGLLICESPILEQDALLLKETYMKL